MSNNIRAAVQTIVDNALSGTGYTRTSPFVKDAVLQVEEGIVEQGNVSADILRRIAQEQGLSESLVENALIEAGLADAPEPEVEDLSDTERIARIEENLGRIEKTLAVIENVARAYGVKV